MAKILRHVPVSARLALACIVGAVVLVPARVLSQDARISVDASQVVNHITPWIYGSCIEDVNHEIYGGLYDQKIFGESFEEPPQSATFAGWKALGGDWRPSGPGVAVSADAGAKLVSDTPAFGDGSVETELRFAPTGGDLAGVLVRVGPDAGVGADAFVGYEVSLGRSGHVLLGKHRHDWQPLRDVAATFTAAGWTRLRVELNGARIRVFINGGAAPLIDFTDTDGPLLTGTFALRTWNSDVAYQNVRVQSGDLPVSEKRIAAVTTPGPVSGMWDALVTGTAKGEFRQDADNPFNGTHCQKIQHGPGAGTVGVANRGLNRWGIAVKKGQTFQGRLYLRASGLQGPVTVALQSADGKTTYAARTIRRVGSAWAKYLFTLTANATDRNARFALWIDRPGTVWADQAVLMGTGDEQFHGLPIRADIARSLVAEGVTFLRYGGTMVNVPGYRWKNMIGDPDRRPPYRGNWYPYSTNGFGIFDFLNFCEVAHIEPAFAINIEETAQDAADLADYLMAPVSNIWGRKRAADGHPAPYRVHHIEIGNEEVLGGDNAAEYDHYIERFNALATAIHAKNPAIQLVCAAWWRPDSPSVERVFQALNGKAAFWDLHVGGDDPRSGAGVDRDLTQMQALFQKWAPGTTMKCVIFEENGGLHNQQRALGHATTLNAARRHGDFVQVDCPANALQPWRQNDNGWDQGQIFFTPDHVWAMPPYFAQQMASLNHLPLRVQSACEGGADLDVTATRSADGKTLVIHVVNNGAAPQKASISVTGFPGLLPQARAWTLAAELQAVNPPDGPETTHPQESALTTGSQFADTFPAHSYTVLRLRR